MSLPQEAKLRTTAVVLAGGTGQRVGLSIPKQLLKIAGKAVIEHTLTIFQNAEDIDDIIVMMAPGFVPDVEKIVVKAQLTKVTRVIEGGATRNETTERAIAALGEGLAENEDRNVLFHDAVRPCCHSVSSRTVWPPSTATRPSTSPSPPRTRSS